MMFSSSKEDMKIAFWITGHKQSKSKQCAKWEGILSRKTMMLN